MKTQAFGIHAVKSLVQFKPQNIQDIYVSVDRDDEKLAWLINECQRLSIPCHKIKRRELDAMTSGNHQGVVANLTDLPEWNEDWLYDLANLAENRLLFLVLDGVQDPHNLGACLRSANAFQVDAVIIPKDRAVGITPTVRKIACGAAELTPLVAVTNLSRTLKKLQEAGVWFIGLAAEAETSLRELDMTSHIGLVMGAEGDGLRRLTAETCDFLGKIPMSGAVESLNVSVSAGIALYEAARQRN